DLGRPSWWDQTSPCPSREQERSAGHSGGGGQSRSDRNRRAYGRGASEGIAASRACSITGEEGGCGDRCGSLSVGTGYCCAWSRDCYSLGIDREKPRCYWLRLVVKRKAPSSVASCVVLGEGG